VVLLGEDSLGVGEREEVRARRRSEKVCRKAWLSKESISNKGSIKDFSKNLIKSYSIT